VLWGIIGLSGGGCWAGDSESDRATLRGVEGMYVIVEELEPEVERAGLTRHQLQTEVELRLRQVGIRVLTKEERLETPGAPWLYVNVNVVLRSDGLTAFSTRVELNQVALLKTDGSLVIVPTWSVAYTGSVGSLRLSAIRNNVKDQVDHFINAYLSVHPRSTGSATPSSTSPRSNLVH